MIPDGRILYRIETTVTAVGFVVVVNSYNFSIFNYISNFGAKRESVVSFRLSSWSRFKTTRRNKGIEMSRLLRINISIKVSQTFYNFLIRAKKCTLPHVTSISLSHVSNSSCICHAVIDDIIGFLQLNLPVPE